MEAALAELLGQSVTLARYLSEDADGNETYDTPVTGIAVRIESFDVAYGRPEDKAQASSLPFITASLIAEMRSPQWAIGDKVTLPTADIVYITKVQPVYDETTTIHHVLIDAETGANR